jgi:hypothetical protein
LKETGLEVVREMKDSIVSVENESRRELEMEREMKDMKI